MSAMAKSAESAPLAMAAQAQSGYQGTSAFKPTPPPVPVFMLQTMTKYEWRPPGESYAAQHYYGRWSRGTFGCCGDPLWCCGLFCPLTYPCFAVHRVVTIIRRIGVLDIPFVGRLDKNNVVRVSILALLLAVLGGVPWYIFCFLIYKGIQARFNIEDTNLCVLFKVVCCHCCTLIKIGRHVDGYHKEIGSPIWV